ncbi:hypothetical protein ACWEIJ_24120 [Lentzea sp. NPDC004789]
MPDLVVGEAPELPDELADLRVRRALRSDAGQRFELVGGDVQQYGEVTEQVGRELWKRPNTGGLGPPRGPLSR